MARTKDFDRYVAASNYPGVIDAPSVTAALGDYLAALGVTREVRQLPLGWDLSTEEPLRKTVSKILDDFAARTGRSAARDALAARAAQDARDALDAGANALRRFALWCLHRGSWWWSWDLSWLVTTHIGAQQTGHHIRWARPLFEAYVAGAWMLYWTEDTLYWVAKPTVRVEIVNGNRRLHCEDGPAVESDAENLYFWHGVMVPAFVVTRPDWITLDHITREPNAEIRRVMMTRFGEDRYITEIGAMPIHSDDTGDLYRVDVPDDEPLTMVRVLNSTPEADGSQKPYWIRVDPALTTARAAVAWTFGMDAQAYRPTAES